MLTKAEATSECAKMGAILPKVNTSEINDLMNMLADIDT